MKYSFTLPLDPNIGTIQYHPAIVKSFSSSGTGSSVELVTAKKSIIFEDGFGFENFRISNSGGGNMLFQIYQEGSLLDQLTIHSFEDGTYIDGFGVFGVGPDTEFSIGDAAVVTRYLQYEDSVIFSLENSTLTFDQSGVTGHYFFEGIHVNGSYYSFRSGVPIYGGQEDDGLHGFNTNDLTGQTYNDTLYGGAGNDYLYGGDGADVLRGGSGFDSLFGGNGDDIYLIYRGDGASDSETAFPRYNLASEALDEGFDTIRFVDVASDEVRFAGIKTRYLSTITDFVFLVPNDYGGYGEFRVNTGFQSSDADPHNWWDIWATIERIEFSDGVVWDETSGLRMMGLDDGGNFYGMDAADVIDGQGGADNISGGGGDDTLYGGSGRDGLRGDAGKDLLFGGEGDDTLSGGNADDTLRGGAGHDRLYGDDGNDVYIVRKGDGANGKSTESGAYEEIYEQYKNGFDTILFQNVNSDEIRVDGQRSQSFNTSQFLVFLVPDGSGGYGELWVHTGVQSQYTNHPGSRPDYWNLWATIERLEFADGAVWDETTGLQMVGLDTGGTLNGMDTSDFIDGRGGRDNINGRSGDDTLYGGNGDDILNGGAGDDTLRGGAGHDRLYGDDGDDVYIIRQGDGANGKSTESGAYEEIYEKFEEGFDTIRFEDVNSDEIRFGGQRSQSYSSSQYLVFLVPDGSGGYGELWVHTGVPSQYASHSDYWNLWATIERLEFADGAAWDETTGLQMVGLDTGGTLNGMETSDFIDGRGGRDNINGRSGDDTLYGGNGDDILNGGDGDDTLRGGAGHDRLYGDDGDDVYIIRQGDGANGKSTESGAYEEIYEQSESGFDTILFEDISSDQIRFGGQQGQTYSTSQYLVFLVPDGDGGYEELSVHTGVQSQFADRPDYWNLWATIERLEFADGVVWDEATGLRMVGLDDGGTLNGMDTSDFIDGRGGADSIEARGGDDTLIGGDGDDFLYGGTGEDVLDGGEGDDFLAGGTGADVFIKKPGQSDDTITDFDVVPGGDRIDVGAYDLRLDQVGFESSGGGLRVLLGEDSIFLRGVGLASLAKMHFIGLAPDSNPPTVSPIDAGRVSEVDPVVVIDLLADAQASDPDGDALSVTNVSVRRDDNVRAPFDLSGSVMTIDPKRFASLLANSEQLILTIAYEVIDGNGAVASNTATLAIHGLDGPFTWRFDADGDGFGVDSDETNVTAYEAPAEGFSTNAGDADDDDETIYPGAPEISDEKDNDQDGLVDEDDPEGPLSLGTREDDRMVGSSASERMKGLAGDDKAVGKGGDDWIKGAAGHDTLNGGDGDDTLIGNAGRDILRGAAASDRLYGGAGDDTLNGGGGDDQLVGGAMDDLVIGQAGRDTLRGGAGDDTLKGGRGGDRIEGQRGDDVLVGNGGPDVFAFKRGDGSDIIRGFQQGHDQIEITRGAADFYDLYIIGSGRDVLIEFANVAITVKNAKSSDFDADDFLF